VKTITVLARLKGEWERGRGGEWESGRMGEGKNGRLGGGKNGRITNYQLPIQDLRTHAKETGFFT